MWLTVSALGLVLFLNGIGKIPDRFWKGLAFQITGGVLTVVGGYFSHTPNPPLTMETVWWRILLVFVLGLCAGSWASWKHATKQSDSAIPFSLLSMICLYLLGRFLHALIP